jgi:hypothetical protein
VSAVRVNTSRTVVGLVFDDVAQRLAELLERNADIPAPVASIVMAQCLLGAISRRPQRCCEVRVGIEARWRRRPQRRLEAVDHLDDALGHRRRALQQLGRVVDFSEQIPEPNGCRNHVTIIRQIYAKAEWPREPASSWHFAVR